MTEETTKFHVIGVDPDTFNTGIAMLSAEMPGRTLERIRVERVFAGEAKGRQIRSRIVQLLDTIDEGLCEMTNELGMHIIPDLVVVEGQAFRPGDPRPDNIVQLGVTQGIAMGIGRLVGKRVEMPLPVTWKGTQDKADHQKKLLAKLGLATDLDEVPGAERLNKTSRKQVVDGIGLALWGLELLAREERKNRMLNR